MDDKSDTKKTLGESLINLAEKEAVEKITVQSIVDNCGLGIQTFYYHFQDKYELINWIYSSNLNRIIKENADNELWSYVIILSIEFIYDFKDFFRNAIKEEGQISFTRLFFLHTKNSYIKYIESHYGKEAITDELLFNISFNCYGAVNMVKKWLLSGTKESARVIGTRISDAMPVRMQEFFRL